MNETNNDNGLWSAIASVLAAGGFFEATGHGWERDYCNDFHRLYRNTEGWCLQIEHVNGGLNVFLLRMGGCSVAVVANEVVTGT